ncbi:synapse-associated protein 1-like isoform X2 [Narcine bancroftii]|uniref:synapse-associated protein 1-like isoform X2 n=1 Tax=Narcine bancroftii TaxID=1343680 RepID=UPI0038311981
MFRGWLSWPGEAAGPGCPEEKGVLLEPKGESPPEEVVSAGLEAEPEPVLEQAGGVASYLRNVATSATKKISDSMRETAQTIKKTVEEHKIGNLLDMTIIGNFNKEQEKFMKEQKSKKSALPPWAGYNKEEPVKQQILSLSEDRRNFLRDPPAGVPFNFDFNTVVPVAVVMLREDKLLNKMRFELVPKLVKEEQFWRNYFYRISLIKQSAQLAGIAAEQPEDCREELDSLASISPATVLPKTSPMPMEKRSVEEDDLRGMEQLDMSGSQPAPANDDDIPEWEKELQRELQEFEIVNEKAKLSDAWEKEIEAMLQEED